MARTRLDVGLTGERVQFRPDLLPADLTGTLEYRPHSGEFNSTTGPLYSNTILAAMLLRPPLYAGIYWYLDGASLQAAWCRNDRGDRVTAPIDFGVFFALCPARFTARRATSGPANAVAASLTSTEPKDRFRTRQVRPRDKAVREFSCHAPAECGQAGRSRS